MTKKITLCAAFALLVVLTGSVPADAAAKTAATKTATAKTTPVASNILNVSVDQGVSMSLSAPAASIFIANPDIADVQVMSPTSVMIFGKRTGETTFMASDANGNTLARRTVVVLQDLSDLRQELDVAIPGNKIKVQSLPNGIVLTGEAHDPGAVADAYKLAQRYLPAQGGDIINRIRVVGSNQIMIRVRFAEVERDIDNTLGIDWDSAASFGGFVFGLGTGNGIVRDATGAIIRPTNTSLTAPNDVFGVSHVGARTNINALIDALAQDGLVTILAEPNLTAMSGETANFLAGGEFPIPIPQGGTSNTITIQFKSFGISLAFTPTLISENRINLHVKPEVSELTNNGAITTDNITVPGLKVRRAETTVELASGESFAIAGLMDNNQAQTVNKYPIVGDLPILGALFRSDHFQSGQTELIVIITPYIVKPVADGQLALPMDGFSPPSEADRILKGRYTSSDPDTRTMSGQPIAAKIDPQPLPKATMTPDADLVAPLSNSVVADPVAPVSAAPASAPVVLPQAKAAPPNTLPPNVLPMNALPPAASPSPVSPTNITPSGPVPTGPGGFTLE